MTKYFYILPSALLLGLLFQACNMPSESRIATEIAEGIFQTQQISELQTSAAGGAQNNQTPQNGANAENTPLAASTEILAPTATLTATLTITFTPTNDVAMISVSEDTNCRTGPAGSYGLLAIANTTEFYEVVGVWDGGTDYVIVNVGTYTCWLWTRYADQKDFSGYDLPSYATPATPTPTVDWSGVWTIWSGDGAGNFGQPTKLTIVQEGNKITASYDSGFITFTGTLSEDKYIVTGTTYSSLTQQTNTFRWKLKGNMIQFIGNTAGQYDFCGARSGASRPSPCFWN